MTFCYVNFTTRDTTHSLAAEDKGGEWNSLKRMRHQNGMIIRLKIILEYHDVANKERESSFSESSRQISSRLLTLKKKKNVSFLRFLHLHLRISFSSLTSSWHVLQNQRALDEFPGRSMADEAMADICYFLIHGKGEKRKMFLSGSLYKKRVRH